MSNLFQHQKLVCCVAAVEHNFQAFEEGVESMENQIFVEVPIFDLFVLFEVGWALLLVSLLTRAVRQTNFCTWKHDLKSLRVFWAFLILSSASSTCSWKWGKQYFHLNCEDGGGINVSASLVDQQIADLLHRPQLKIFQWQHSCLNQDDDPGGWAVVLAGGEDEADDVHHRGEDWAKLPKVCLFHGLGGSVRKGNFKVNLNMGFQRTQVDWYVLGFCQCSNNVAKHWPGKWKSRTGMMCRII